MGVPGGVHRAAAAAIASHVLAGKLYPGLGRAGRRRRRQRQRRRRAGGSGVRPRPSPVTTPPLRPAGQWGSGGGGAGAGPALLCNSLKSPESGRGESGCARRARVGGLLKRPRTATSMPLLPFFPPLAQEEVLQRPRQSASLFSASGYPHPPPGWGTHMREKTGWVLQGCREEMGIHWGKEGRGMGSP